VAVRSCAQLAASTGRSRAIPHHPHPVPPTLHSQTMPCPAWDQMGDEGLGLPSWVAFVPEMIVRRGPHATHELVGFVQ
jgi:hypothetical protein